MILDIMENSDSIVEAVRAVYIEEGNDTPPSGLPSGFTDIAKHMRQLNSLPTRGR
jgi:hypothetical protein